MKQNPNESPVEVTSPTRIRFVVVGVATLMAVMLYLDRVCISQAADRIKVDLDLTDKQMALVLGTFFFTYALGQVPAGWLADRFGVRRMLTIFLVAWSLMTMATGLATGFVSLFIYRLAFGVAQAGAYPAAGSMLSKWIEVSRRAAASGIVSFGGRIGGALAPLATAGLIVWLGGWRPMFLCYGLLSLVVAGVCAVMLRNRPSEHPWCNQAEIDLVASQQPLVVEKPGAPPLGAMLTNASLWYMGASQFFTNLGWAFLVTLMPGYLKSLGADETTSGAVGSFVLFVGMAGMFAGGFITDFTTTKLGLRWGRVAPIAVTRVLVAISFLVCPWLPSPWLAAIPLACVAIFTDLGTPACWAYAQDVGGKHVGSVLGWANMIGNFGAFFSPIVLQGALDASGKNWSVAFGVCAASFVLSGLASLGIDSRKPVCA